jgi:hypothetical protein
LNTFSLDLAHNLTNQCNLLKLVLFTELDGILKESVERYMAQLCMIKELFVSMEEELGLTEISRGFVLTPPIVWKIVYCCQQIMSLLKAVFRIRDPVLF